MKINKNKTIESAKRLFLMLVGCAFYAISTSLFLAPNQITAGGVSGLAVVVNILNDKLPIGLVIIAINIPILIAGIKFYGIKFVLKCLLTVACLGGFTDLFSLISPLVQDSLLSAIYGGLCQGIGIGLFVKYEYSSGGTELLGRLVSRLFKLHKIPLCVGILDALIVVFGAIVTRSAENMLYALIVIFVSTRISEIILTGLEKSKLCIIITDKGEEISNVLIKNSPRGVTMINGEGMYTKKEHDVLLTCVKNRQLTLLKQLVKSVDENAFIIINESVEVRGKGFKSMKEIENFKSNNLKRKKDKNTN